jgi:hypothetical protein
MGLRIDLAHLLYHRHRQTSAHVHRQVDGHQFSGLNGFNIE